jgi:hypothetical protein
MGQKADAIRNAVYGKDVRETMAQLAEDEEQLREDYNAQVINAGSSNAEIVDARGNFFKLKDRLDDTNSQLAGKANQSDITALNAKVGNMGNTKTFKGSCLFANLPTTGNAVDDYYYVTDKTTNYCWNGVAWIDIGNNVNVGDLSIINSKIALRSISPSKLSFTTVEGIQSKNLFNKNKVTIGYFVEFDNGLLYANSDYNVNTVEISPNTQYTLKHVDQSAFYDIEGKYISGFNSAGTNTFVSPDNAYFMKISTINANLNTQQLELGSSSTAYESGGNKFDGQYLKQMSVDWQQIKNPLAFILQNNSIIVNLQTKKISIPNYFYIITKQYAIDIPSQADIDFSALESNNIWICYYDISTGTIKITEFYNSLSLHVILFYMYNNNIIR